MQITTITITTLLCAALLAGCSSSSSTDSDNTFIPVASTDTADVSDALILADQVLADEIASDSSLGGSVRQIEAIARVGSLNALANLNAAYTSGLLTPARVDCVDEEAGFPLLTYYCGENGIGERLEDFGYPAFALTFQDDGECRNSLVNENTAAACTLTYSEAELAGEWFVKYTLDDSDVVSLTLSDGVVPEFVEFQESSPVCEIEMSGNDLIEYSDEATCRVSVTQVLAILQAP